MEIAVLGIDIGKNVCSVVGLHDTGAVVLRRRVRRDTLVALVGKLPGLHCCFDTGWVCEEHPGRPWRGASKRADASDCCDVGTPCAQCIPCGGIDEPPDLSRSVMRVMIDAKERPATLKPMDRGDRSRFWSSLTTATALQLSEGTGETQFKSPSAQPQALDEDLRAACQS